MNSKNNKTRFLHNLTDKIDLQRGEKKTLLYKILVFTAHGKT